MVSRKKQQEKSEAEEIKVGDLCPEVVDSILSCIPLKSLTRLKCVSKEWCNFINVFRQRNPPTTSSGLVFLLNHMNEQFLESTFIKFSQGQEAYTTHASIRHNFPLHLIDSCNGLLLYGTSNGDSWSYYVCSPFLGQCLALPWAHKIRRPACVGLAFDGKYHDNFRVICFFWREFDLLPGTIKCKIFWSETWKWRDHEARILYSDLLLEDGFDPGQCFRSSVYCWGRLYWIWSSCLLVYDIESEFFKLIPLQLKHRFKQNSLDMLSQLLWESEGPIYFCYPLNGGICIFKYIGGEDFHGDAMVDYSMVGWLWQFNQFVMLKGQKFASLSTGEVLKLRGPCRILPCAFNQDLQLLYLLVPPGSILAYSFETQELLQVWSLVDDEGGDSFIGKFFAFLFKSVDPALL